MVIMHVWFIGLRVHSEQHQSKGPTAGSLDGWGWRELKVLPVSWLPQFRILVFGLMDYWMFILP